MSNDSEASKDSLHPHEDYKYIGLSYWAARKAIEAAARHGHDNDLRILERLYPLVFKQMANNASNAMKRRPARR